MATTKSLGPENPPSKVAYREVTQNDMKDPRLAGLNAQLLQITQAVNGALGYHGTVMLVAGIQTDGDVNANGSSVIGFVKLTPSTVPVVTGSKAGNVALASLIKALAGLGLIQDQTT